MAADLFEYERVFSKASYSTVERSNWNSDIAKAKETRRYWLSLKFSNLYPLRIFKNPTLSRKRNLQNIPGPNKRHTSGSVSSRENSPWRDLLRTCDKSGKSSRVQYKAMAQSFQGTGHWYYCPNGHPFTVCECGMPMQTSRCPHCGASVGGSDNQAVEGVTRATDFEAELGRR